MIGDKKEEDLNSILLNISKEKFKVLKIFKSDFSSGVAVVKNIKLAGRIEDVKFLESVEPNLKEQFKKEGKILSALHHSNIPQVFDLLEYEDLLLFRTEHIEGYSLKEVLEAFKERKQKFPRNTAISIIKKLSKALHYTHNEVRYDNKKQSIIHCDIKPSNIILTSKNHERKNHVDDGFIEEIMNNNVEPYLVDFGIARFQGKTKDITGTINYLSSQQVNKDNIDWKTDYHQLLLVLYEILSGKKPYYNLPRTKIIEKKKNNDFKARGKNIPNNIKKLIDKGTKKDYEQSFRTEKEFLKEIRKLDLKERRIEFVEKYKKPTIATFMLFLLISLSFVAYGFLDSYSRSIDSIIKKIENNPNPSLEELEISLEKLQKRGFEKKYYEPLLRGDFKDKKTGRLLYPSHLNADGAWAYVDATDNEAGVFAGMLFNQVDKYPDLMDYAIEYVKPILGAEYDGSNSRKYAYALIPAYEKTKDKKYLDKLINISDVHKKAFEKRKGSIQTVDLYHIQLFIWLYNQTGKIKYLNIAEKYMLQFIENNIDEDGYVYEYSAINATTPNSFIPYLKVSRLVTSFDVHSIGNYLPNHLLNESDFKKMTSIFSRDFVQAMILLHESYETTDKQIYKDYLDKTTEYYNERMSKDYIDFFFVSYLNEENDIPKDSLATVKSIQFFKGKDNELYYQKLKGLFTSQYFRKEKENAILSGSVHIVSVFYDHSDQTIKNQSLILTDRLFLEI